MRISPLLDRLSARRSGEAGYILIEVMVAAALIAIASAVLLGAFDSSRLEASYSEKQNTGAAIADEALQRITSLKWSEISLNKASSWTAGSTKSTDPTSYLSPGPCDTAANLTQHEPCYQYDWTNSAHVEPLVTVASGYDAKSDPYPFETLTADGKTRLSGSVYRYITWVNDSKCEGTNNTCGGENDAKRLTVAVVVSGLKNPVVVSSLYANPTGKEKNPLVAGAKCREGAEEVPCTH
jgi:type II secretory pathway pseudopilin PulG